MRTVVVHYHTFKNAGTSLDRLLELNYGRRWGTLEGPVARRRLEPEALRAHLEAHPEIEALSSHTALMNPAVADADLQLFPLVLLRNPLDRIRSAYNFERKQQVGTPGAN